MSIIKVHKRGKRNGWFLTSKQGLNGLRVHAAQWTDHGKAKELAAKLQQINPDYTFEAREL